MQPHYIKGVINIYIITAKYYFLKTSLLVNIPVNLWLRTLYFMSMVRGRHQKRKRKKSKEKLKNNK